MSTTTRTVDSALLAYEQLAPYYDLFMRPYDNERWLANLEAIAQEHGLEGKRLLDVACGTGRSFVPMLKRGYEVSACDISPAMVAEARHIAGEQAELFVADMRELPGVGEFDLITCLDDSLNYLLSDADLERALESMAQNLRPGGVLVFDLNSALVYKRLFSQDAISEAGPAVFCWRGQGESDFAPGDVRTVMLDVFHRDGFDVWTRTSSTHVQRHHPREAVARALERAGLSLVTVRGQVTGAAIEDPPDEERHIKLVYVARRPRESGRG